MHKWKLGTGVFLHFFPKLGQALKCNFLIIAKTITEILEMGGFHNECLRYSKSISL